ncbi:unnamed protein product [Natator depressus]
MEDPCVEFSRTILSGDEDGFPIPRWPLALYSQIPKTIGDLKEARVFYREDMYLHPDSDPSLCLHEWIVSRMSSLAHSAQWKLTLHFFPQQNFKVDNAYPPGLHCIPTPLLLRAVVDLVRRQAETLRRQTLGLQFASRLLDWISHGQAPHKPTGSEKARLKLCSTIASSGDIPGGVLLKHTQAVWFILPLSLLT